MSQKELSFTTEESALASLCALYDRYGYSRFRMSKFEEYDLYVRNKSFLLSDHMITFTDTSGKLMALKPDVTLSIVKNSRDVAGSVQKVYYRENVYRVAKGGHGFSEIMQLGLECMGDIDTYCTAEVLMLAAESLSALSEDFVLDVSHLGVLSSILDGMGADDRTRRELIACVGEKNLHGIAAICEAAGIASEKAEALKTLVSRYGDAEQVLDALTPFVTDESGLAALSELREVLAVLRSAGYGNRVRVDFSVVNDLSYYNGIVFRGFVRDVPAGVLSGGRYDLLMQKMGKKAGAIGFAVYPDLLVGLSAPDNEYDVDAVLLYDESTDPVALFEKVRALCDSGVSVTVQRSVPEKLRYRQLLKWQEGEVTVLEENA